MLLYFIKFTAIVVAQSVDLLGPGESVCPGGKTVFTCIANVTGILSWISPCYIGGNGRSLSFPSNTYPGLRMNSKLNPNNYAILNSVSNDTGVVELNSTFTIEEPIEGPCTVL